MIEIDGNFLEGGGQIVRTALALSIITQQSFRCSNIRAGRPTPGLKQQHLTGIQTLVANSGSRCDGADIGSTKISFYPKPLKGISENIDIGTAGSVTLLLQTLMLPCILGKKKSKFTIIGGTDVSWSPSIDYFINVFVPHMQKYAKVDIKRLKRGYYPKGGGEVEVSIKPLHSLKDKSSASRIELLNQGTLLEIVGISHSSRTLLDAEVADRQRTATQLVLAPVKAPLRLSAEYGQTLSDGSGVTLWAVYRIPGEANDINPVILGSDILGEKGVRSEMIGSNVAKELLKDIHSKSCVDTHLCDQLIPYLALFGGSMRVSSISNHTLTNIYVVEKFLGVTFDVDQENLVITVKDPFELTDEQKKLLP